MKKKKSFQFVLVLLFGLIMSTSTIAHALNVDDYELVGKERVGRTEFNYTYRANIHNTQWAVQGVVATLSSASSNTVVIDGELEFGDVGAGESVASLDTFTVRHNRRFPFNWDDLSWNVTWIPPSNVQSVDQSGGTLVFPNGITLDFPVNAVSGLTEITVHGRDCAQLNPALNSKSLQSHQKECLVAFSAEPTGLEFDQPIVARVPLPSLASGTVPMLTLFDTQSQAYEIVPTDMSYNISDGMVEFTLPHFSEVAVSNIGLTSVEKYGSDLSEAGDVIGDRCGSCEAQSADGGINQQFCDGVEALQDACCHIPRAQRQQCFNDCDCCMEQRIRVVSSSVDVSSGGCQFIGDMLRVTYLDCPGSPTFEHNITESSDECPDDMQWEIIVEQEADEVWACESIQLKAYLTGRTPDGRVEVAPVEFQPQWLSLDPARASIDDTGVLTGHKAGAVSIEARVGDDPNIEPGRVLITVKPNIQSFELGMDRNTVDRGQSLLVHAITIPTPDRPPANWPPLDPNAVTWSVGNPDKLGLTTNGSIAFVEGLDTGNSSLCAEFNYNDCERHVACQDITVECPPIEFQTSPQSLRLLVGDTGIISTELRDENGPLDASSVTWTTTTPGSVRFFWTQGDRVAFEGLIPRHGSIYIKGTYDDGCQVKEASTEVFIQCPSLRLSTTKGLVETDSFMPISLSVVDPRGKPAANVDESKITWQSSNPQVASVIPSTGPLTAVIGITPGPVTITASYDGGTCGIRTAIARLSVVPEIPDMAGNWLETVTGGQECEIFTWEDLETEYFEDDWIGETMEVMTTQVGSQITGVPVSDPDSIPYEGSIVTTSDPDFPYRLNLKISSSDSLDCRRFIETNGSILKFGDAPCGGRIQCQPKGCFETEWISIRISRDATRFEGTSRHRFRAVTDAIAGMYIYTNAEINCEGGSFIEGERIPEE